MSEKIQIFGATPSPYTQKMISIFRYKHIAYEAIGSSPAKTDKKGLSDVLKNSLAFL